MVMAQGLSVPRRVEKGAEVMCRLDPKAGNWGRPA
jgi:hypothetical protein